MTGFTTIEGRVLGLGTVSGTDETPLSLYEPTHAVRVYLENPTTINTGTVNQIGVTSITASGTTITGSVTLEGEGGTWLSVSGNSITVHSTAGAATSYVHTQVGPASTWNIIHGLGSDHPIVQIYDTNNVVIQPDSITADDGNTLTIVFNQSVSGTGAVLKV